MSRMLFLLMFFRLGDVTGVKAQPRKYSSALHFRVYDKNGSLISPGSEYKVRPSFQKDSLLHFPDSFSFNASPSYVHYYDYKFPRSIGGGIVPRDFRILVIHRKDTMIIDPDACAYRDGTVMLFDSIPFTKGSFYLPRRWHFSFNNDKIYTGGDLYPLKWENFEISKQLKPLAILYEKLYDASFEKIFFSPQPEFNRLGLYAVGKDFYNHAVIFKKGDPVDSPVIKTGMSLYFFDRPIRFCQGYRKTFIYQENTGFLYHSEDTALKNWKMAFFEASPSMNSGNPEDYGFWLKEIKISDEGYIIALGAIVFLYRSQIRGIPAWYRLYFDVEPGSEKYLDIKKRTKQQIEDYLQIK